MKKEIETKARIDSYEKIADALRARGSVFSAVQKQEDRYFCNFEEDFSVWKPKANFLRIRKQGERIFLTLKQPQSNELDVIEKSLVIDSEDSAAELVVLLGYHEVVSVIKERMTTKVDDFTICLDRVHGLGDFIEIEYIGEKEASLVQSEQKDFLLSLQIPLTHILIQGYDTMMYEKLAQKEEKM